MDRTNAIVRVLITSASTGAVLDRCEVSMTDVDACGEQALSDHIHNTLDDDVMLDVVPVEE